MILKGVMCFKMKVVNKLHLGHNGKTSLDCQSWETEFTHDISRNEKKLEKVP